MWTKQLFFSIYLAVLIPVWGLAQTSQDLPPPQFESVFRKTSDAILLDVRTPAETFFGTIELGRKVQELNYYSSDFEEEIKKLDKNKTYFVYCRTGIRSRKTIKLMQKYGFKKLINLKGGYNAWREQD